MEKIMEMRDIISYRTIYLTLVGSHAYGMARPESDVDIRGICIPTREYFHGYAKRFEQFEAEWPRHAPVGNREKEGSKPSLVERLQEMVGREIPEDEAIDSTVYGLRKFFKLAADCNPNIIELLFSDPSCHVLTTSFFRELEENRHLFLSAKAKFTFSGYAHAQLKRIRTHRKWLLNPPARKPEREDYGLVNRTLIPKDQLQAAESLIKKKVDGWTLLDTEIPRDVLIAVRQETTRSLAEVFEAFRMSAPLDEDGDPDREALEKAAGALLGFSDNFLEHLDRERRYKSALRNWQQYEHWKKTRNEARAKLEAEHGYDTKHASHLVRLLRMAKEILSEGKVIVRRPDADELSAIRGGAWDFDQLMDYASGMEEELDRLYREGNYPVPKKVDQEALDRLCMRLVERALGQA